MLPSKEVFEQVSLLITTVSALLTLLTHLSKKLPSRAKQLLGYVFGAVALCSLGFYAGFLHYERNWVLTNHVQGPIYDFAVKQAARETWCQWMLDRQNTDALKREGVSVFERLSLGDFLYDGGSRRPRVGYWSAHDNLPPREPLGRVAVAIYDYALARFPKAATAKLTLKVSKYTSELPPNIAVVINDHPVQTIKTDKHSIEVSVRVEPSGRS